LCPDGNGGGDAMKNVIAQTKRGGCIFIKPPHNFLKKFFMPEQGIFLLSYISVPVLVCPNVSL
ncbi:MAG: hypothetical protein U9M90_03135, partial [Patescibacteria group bacterium]|nr:hypothetical protein [Patescibacteria group bacterium]